MTDDLVGLSQLEVVDQLENMLQLPGLSTERRERRCAKRTTMISATRISIATKFAHGRAGSAACIADEIQDCLRRSGEIVVQQLCKPELMMSHT